MPLFTQLASTSSTATTIPGGDDSDSGLNITSLLGSATSLADAATIVADAIRTKLSKLLNISIESIDGSKSVSSNGVDSLVAVEFRTWLAKVVAADVPLLDILGTMPISGLSAKVVGVSKLVSGHLKGERGTYSEDGGLKEMGN